MWIRPVYALFLPVLLVTSALSGWASHRPGTTKPSPSPSAISLSSTAAQVESHFNLGTNDVGLQQFTDTSCITRPKYDVCAWDYTPPNHKWAVTLFLREPRGSTAHNPPLKDN